MGNSIYMSSKIWNLNFYNIVGLTKYMWLASVVSVISTDIYSNISNKKKLKTSRENLEECKWSYNFLEREYADKV